jgi:hypothetical protein
MAATAEHFRAAASRVADELLVSAIADGDAIKWETASFQRNTIILRWIAQPDLYAGVAGITLFLVEAAEVLGRPELLDAARAGLRWCTRSARELPSFGFYAGRLGVSYAMLRAGMQQEALDLVRDYEPYARRAEVTDILSGTAGAALGFLHLHQATGEAWTATAAELMLRHAMRDARWMKEGVCWNVRPENMTGLCGMSHGNAGIALVLLEASRYLDQPAYRTLALQALRYESSCFRPEEGTWPDFRKITHATDEEFERDYGRQPEESFATHTYMDAWCHGAPGIGLTRVRCAELLGDEWLSDLRVAVERTRRMAVGADRTFTLCHGTCGNAVLFLEAEPLIGDPSLRALSEEAGTRAIAARERDGTWVSGYQPLGSTEDLCLMLGNSGIGYFLLQLAAPGRTNILLPRLSGGVATSERVGEGEIAHALTARLVPRTLAAVEHSQPGEASAFFSRWRERDEALAFVMSDSTPHAALESEMLRMWEGCRSFALVRFQQWRARKQARTLLHADALDGVSLRLTPHVRLHVDGAGTVLLRIIDGEVVDQTLTPLAAAVLAVFESPCTMGEAIRELAGEAEGAEHDAIARAVREQIRQAVAAAILEAVSPSGPTA